MPGHWEEASGDAQDVPGDDHEVIGYGEKVSGVTQEISGATETASGETQDVIGGTGKVSGGTRGVKGNELALCGAGFCGFPNGEGRAGCPHPAVGYPDATGVQRRAEDRCALPAFGGRDRL